MRVLHTFAGRNLGGVELRILDQVQWLLDHNCFGMVAAPHDSMVAELCRERDLPLVEIDFHRPFDQRVILALRRVLRRRQITVIDTHTHRDAMTAMFCRDLSAVVRTRHIAKVLKPSWRRQLHWRKGCNHVIATAACIAEGLLASGLATPERLSIVGEWAGDEFFEERDPEKSRCAARRHLGFDDDAFVVATIGMLRPDKRQEDLLRVVQVLRRRDMPAFALILGAATAETQCYESKLHLLARDLGINHCTVFAGFCSNLPDLLRGIDAVLVPSESEAWSRVVPEAFASTKPVVASRIGGLPELVIPGETGWLAEVGDVDGFAEHLEAIVRRPAEAVRIASTARRLAEQILRLGGRMEETLAAYERAITRANVAAGVFPH